MLTAVLKAVKMLLFCCPKNSQDADVITALKAVQNAEKNHPHKDQVQRLIPITIMPLGFRAIVQSMTRQTTARSCNKKAVMEPKWQAKRQHNTTVCRMCLLSQKRANERLSRGDHRRLTDAGKIN
jgi:hypothetical protein